MPDQNPTDPQNQVQSSIADTGATAPVPMADTPPVIPPQDSAASLPLDVPPPPPIIQSGQYSGSAAPPPGEPEEMPKKKFGRGKVIATILGILILVGGLGAGLFLVGRQQLFKQKATTPGTCQCSPIEGFCATVTSNNCNSGYAPVCDTTSCDTACTCISTPPTCSGQCIPGTSCTDEGCTNAAGSCSGSLKCCACPTCLGLGQLCGSPGDTCCTGLTCTVTDSFSGVSTCEETPTGTPTGTPTTTPPTCSGQCIPGTSCTDEGCTGATGSCSGSLKCCACPTATPTCTESCQPDHLDPNGYCGSTGNQFWCQKVIGDYGVLKSCYGACRDPYTYSSGDYCLDTQHGRNCDAGVRCSTDKDPRCTGGSPPTLPPETAQCLAVKAYDTNWTELTAAQRSALTAGAKVRFAVGGTASSGSFDKAVFKINGAETGEISGDANKQPGTNNFFYEYTIPPIVTSFTVDAKIHHTELGWSNY